MNVGEGDWISWISRRKAFRPILRDPRDLSIYRHATNVNIKLLETTIYIL